AAEAATDRLPRRRFATTPSGLGRSIGWGPPASRIVASRDDSPAYGPTEVPLAHRRLFLDAARAVIRVDGVKPAELDALSLFEDLVR
ncbi:MAG: hypothetical protein HZB39_07005, partial [Planctomycetes bacterium]|nr:hypothetical protein [Planctomycetota bacterium]